MRRLPRRGARRTKPCLASSSSGSPRTVGGRGSSRSGARRAGGPTTSSTSTLPASRPSCSRRRAPRHVIERSALLSTFNSHREAVMLRAAPGPRREGAALPRVPRRQRVAAHGEGRGFGAGARTRGPSSSCAASRARLRGATRVALHRLDVGDLDLDRRPARSPADGRGARARQLPGSIAETDLDTVLRRRPQLADPLLALARVLGPPTVSRRSIGRRRWSRAIADPTSSFSPAIG